MYYLISIFLLLLTSNLVLSKAIDEVKVLACTAISKTIMSNNDFYSQYKNQIDLFMTISNMKIESSTSLVNLIALNNCFKEFDSSTAGTIIQERATDGRINPNYISYLKINSIYENYISLTNSDKVTFLDELKIVKDALIELKEVLKRVENNEYDDQTLQNSSLFHILYNTIYYFVVDNIYIIIGISLVVMTQLAFLIKIKRKKRRDESNDN